MPEAPVQPQPQVTTSKSTDWKKVRLTVLIIVVVVGLIAGIYWFMVVNKASEDSDLTGPVPSIITVDWKTYENSTVGFQMKHSSHITVTTQKAIKGFRSFPVEGANKSPDTISTFVQENPDFNPSEHPGEELGPFLLRTLLTYDLWIEVGNIPIDSPIDLKILAEAYKDKDLFGPGSGGFPEDFGKIKAVTVGGKSGYKITRLGGNVEYMIFLPGKNSSEIIYIEAKILTYTELDGAAFGIKENPDGPEPISPRYEKNKELFNSMLTTFRFL